MSVHLCRGPGLSYRTVRYCRWCDSRTRHVVRDDVWWGATLVCTGCGVEIDSTYGERRKPKVGVDRRPLIAAWNNAMRRGEYEAALADYLGIEGSET